MSLLVLSGTKQGEQVHLLITEGDDKPFVKTKSSSFKGRVVEVIHKEKEYNGDVTNTFNVRFEARGQSHYFMMKSGSLALSVVNSLAGATTKQLEDVEFSFYVNKEGFNSVSVRSFNGLMEDKPNGDQVKKYERLDWKISIEEKNKLTRKFVGKGGKEDSDNSEYVKALIALLPDLNANCPSRLVQGGSSDLFDEVVDYSVDNASAQPRQSVNAQATALADEAMGSPATNNDDDLPFV